MEEIWKDIPGYPGYKASNLGRIKGPRNILSLQKGQYSTVSIHKHTITVHKLIAKTFIPNPDNLPCIDHINTNRYDNRIENLRWVTYSGNRCNPLTTAKFINNTTMKEKLSAGHILQYDLNKNLIREWISPYDVKRELGFDQTIIVDCVLGNEGIISERCRKRGYKTPKTQAYGYIWKRKSQV